MVHSVPEGHEVSFVLSLFNTQISRDIGRMDSFADNLESTNLYGKGHLAVSGGNMKISGIVRVFIFCDPEIIIISIFAQKLWSKNVLCVFLFIYLVFRFCLFALCFSNGRKSNTP